MTCGEEKSERGVFFFFFFWGGAAFKCRRWQHARPRMYRLCGSARSLSRRGALPLFLLAALFFTLSCLFTFLPPLSLSPSLALFSSGCYISIMQPLPASEGERIRPTLPSVVACQPRLYVLSRLTEMAAALSLSPPRIWKRRWQDYN